MPTVRRQQLKWHGQRNCRAMWLWTVFSAYAAEKTARHIESVGVEIHQTQLKGVLSPQWRLEDGGLCAESAARSDLVTGRPGTARLGPIGPHNTMDWKPSARYEPQSNIPSRYAHFDKLIGLAHTTGSKLRAETRVESCQRLLKFMEVNWLHLNQLPLDLHYKNWNKGFVLCWEDIEK